MNIRRFHERPLRLIHVRPAGFGPAETDPWRHDEYRLDPRGQWWANDDHGPEPGEHAAILLEREAGRGWLLAPTPITPIPVDGPGQLGEAVILAADTGRALRRDLDRLRRYERFVVLADLLASADFPAEVFGPLSEHLAPILDAWVAIVLYRHPGTGHQEAGALRALPVPELGIEQMSIEVSAEAPLPELGLLSWNDAPGPDPLFAPLRTLFASTPIRRMAYAAIDDRAIVFVADRRADREFGPQDWDLLQVAVRQARAAIQRLS